MAHVVSVTPESPGSENAVWTFDHPVDSIGDYEGLIFADERGIFSASVSGEFTLTASYDDIVLAGDGWILDAALAAIVFTDGATIADAAGEVVP